MPILKRNTLLLLICTLTLLSCDPPEFKEDLFSASFIKNDENEMGKGKGKGPKDLKDPEPEGEKPIDLIAPKSRKVKETFYQVKSQREKLDILWVVDNSGSMEEEQDSLARNFDLFIEEFLKKGGEIEQVDITVSQLKSLTVSRKFFAKTHYLVVNNHQKRN